MFLEISGELMDTLSKSKSVVRTTTTMSALKALRRDSSLGDSIVARRTVCSPSPPGISPALSHQHKAQVNSEHFSPRLISIGFGWLLGLTPYNKRWRHSRRLFHRYFQPSAVPQFCPKKIKATCRFLQKLLDSPDSFHALTQLYVLT